MKPWVKNGLIAGSAGAIAGGCLTAGFGSVCGPAIAVLVGALAGHFTAREAAAASKREGARVGAMSGVIAGTLVVVGQLVVRGFIVASLPQRIESLAAPSGPDALTPEAFYTVAYVSALATIGCLALINGLVTALAGAVAGYRTAPVRPEEAPGQDNAAAPAMP